MKFVCNLCNKEFKQKSHYDSHKARKRPCVKNTIIDPNIVASDSIPITKPFLKWVGGKTQIINEVIDLFPKTMNSYYEPFLGGGSVLLSLLSQIKAGKIIVNGTVYASDFNSNLIGLYKNIQNTPDEFITEVKKLIVEFSNCKDTIINRKPTNIDEAMSSQESYYFWIRQTFNTFSKEQKMSITGSAMMLFMNKTGFRGMYREGPNGINVPFGNYKNPSILDEEHIRQVSLLIKDVVFTHSSFEEILNKVVTGDFVYMDPPYAPETETSFVGYNLDGFDLKKHLLLFNLCNSFTSKGVKMLMSNANVKLVRDTFNNGFHTKIVTCRRAINSKEPGSTTNEVLISN
jgi:DNA adenine methylase